jgi:hypothetical protein
MVNATEMAKPFGSHKKPNNWLKSLILSKQTQKRKKSTVFILF